MNAIKKINPYEELNKMNAHWDRISPTEIVVWTSGYLTAECHEIESYLMQFQIIAMDQKFDSHCGKTRTVYLERRPERYRD